MIYYVFIGSLLHYTYVAIKYICIGVEYELNKLYHIVSTVDSAFDQIDQTIDNINYIYNYINYSIKTIKNNLI